MAAFPDPALSASRHDTCHLITRTPSLHRQQAGPRAIGAGGARIARCAGHDCLVRPSDGISPVPAPGGDIGQGVRRRCCGAGSTEALPLAAWGDRGGRRRSLPECNRIIRGVARHRVCNGCTTPSRAVRAIVAASAAPSAVAEADSSRDRLCARDVLENSQGFAASARPVRGKTGRSACRTARGACRRGRADRRLASGARCGGVFAVGRLNRACSTSQERGRTSWVFCSSHDGVGRAGHGRGRRWRSC